MHPPTDQETRAIWSKFCNVATDHQSVDALVVASKSVHLDNGAVLLNQGNPTDAVFMIVSGELKVVKYSENGNEVWLANIASGDLVGEIGALTGVERTSTILATSDCDVLALPADKFKSIIARHSVFGNAIAALLANRLQNTTRKLSQLIGMPVAARLHSELIRIGKVSAQDSEVLEILSEVTVSVLAERIHATR